MKKPTPIFRGRLQSTVSVSSFADLCLTSWRRRPKSTTAGPSRTRLRFARPTVRLRASRRFGGQPSREEWLASRSSLAQQQSEGWSGKRDSNPRLRPWQGRTLPLSYSRSNPQSTTRLGHLSTRSRTPEARRSRTTRADHPRAEADQVATVRSTRAASSGDVGLM
jgi:hypothetical protein